MNPGLIVPYPTLGEINKRVAGAYFAPKLFSRQNTQVGAPAGPARLSTNAGANCRMAVLGQVLLT